MPIRQERLRDPLTLAASWDAHPHVHGPGTIPKNIEFFGYCLRNYSHACGLSQNYRYICTTNLTIRVVIYLNGRTVGPGGLRWLRVQIRQLAHQECDQ